MQYNYDYFISYAHKDNQSENGKPGFVDEFVEKLKNSTDHKQMFDREIEVFFDKTKIHSMSDWDNRIRSSLASSRFFVVLLSPNYFKSEYCAREFEWWMQHEMHRRVLGEGTAPMLIVSVNDLYNFNVDPLPEIPKDIQVKFPDWVKQIRQIQSGPDFDMHDLERAKIDEILRALCKNTKDKYFKQVIAEESPINAGYPKYNENFVGRRENLRSLRQMLSTSCTTAISAVNGLGGIGKTELALTYGHAFAWDYELGRVFATCENADSLEDVILSSSIAEMHGLKLEGTNQQQLTTLYNTLKQKIKLIEERNKNENVDNTLGAHVLLILDNVNRLELISQDSLDKLPDFFHVIITTRESANEFPHIHTESVDRLSEDESVELLGNLREFGDDPQEALAAREIAKLLDGFTLAVELTGAYLKKSPRITYQKQYDRLKANVSDAMGTMADKTQKLRRHQAECISAVLDSTLSALSDNARKALEFAALMPPDAVGLGWLPELLGLDEDEGWEVLDELTGYSLLTPLESEPNIARIHRLVAETVKQEIPEETQQGIIDKIRGKCDTLLKNAESFWYSSGNSWNITPLSEWSMAILEHWSVENSEELDNLNLTWHLGASGDILRSIGKINEARRVFQRCYEIYDELVKLFPTRVEVLQYVSIFYYKLGDLEKDVGNVAAAREWYEKLLEISQCVVDQLPNDVAALRNLSISYERLAELERIVGNAVASRDWYIKASKIRHRLADEMPDDVVALRNLGCSYGNLGDLDNVAGNVDTARVFYEKGLVIFQQLADMLPNDAGTQRDLSVSCIKLGDLENNVGSVAAARERYEKALEIARRIADLMPNNVQAQRDLSILYERLGILENDAGNIGDARILFEKALVINEKLAKIVTDNIDVQKAPSVIYFFLGKLEKAAGNVDAARVWYDKALMILLRLVNQMSENVGIQRSLGILCKDYGYLEKEAGNITATKKWYEKELEIYKRLVEQLANNVDDMLNLRASYERLGHLEFATFNVAAARNCYEKALEIDQRLADLLPENVDFQRNLSISYARIGDLENMFGSAAAAKELFEKSQKIHQRLVEIMPENVQLQVELNAFLQRLKDL